MPVTYHILPALGIVHFHFAGHIRAGETGEAFQDYLLSPGYDADLRQFANFTDIAGAQFDLAKAVGTMQVSARSFADSIEKERPLFLAPSDVAQSIAQLVVRLWQQHTGMTPLVVDTAQGVQAALDLSDQDTAALLGLPGDQIRPPAGPKGAASKNGH